MNISSLPERLDIPAAWIGADIREVPDTWRWHLSTTEVAELEDAARAFLAQYGDISHLRRETFVVPSLRPKLERGDMQFVYNHSLLHDRTSFVDWRMHFS